MIVHRLRPHALFYPEIATSLLVFMLSACGNTASSHSETPPTWTFREEVAGDDHRTRNEEELLSRPVLNHLRSPARCHALPYKIWVTTHMHFVQGEPLHIRLISHDGEDIMTMTVDTAHFDAPGSYVPQLWGYKHVRENGYLALFLDRQTDDFMGFDPDTLQALGVKDHGEQQMTTQGHHAIDYSSQKAPNVEVCQQHRCVTTNKVERLYANEDYPGLACMMLTLEVDASTSPAP